MAEVRIVKRAEFAGREAFSGQRVPQVIVGLAAIRGGVMVSADHDRDDRFRQ